MGERHDAQVRVAAFGSDGCGSNDSGVAQQPSTQPTRPDTTQTNATPTEGSTAAECAPSTTRRSNSSRSTPATSSSPRRAVTRRCPTCRWRSARSPRTRCRTAAPPTSASSTSFLRRCWFPRPRRKAAPRVARIRGIGTVGDNPGLEGSVATYHRRRLSLAHRRRADRTRAARPDRGAARTPGHIVRAQRLGRRDLGDHRQAAVHALRVGRSEHRQLRLSPLRGVAQRAARRNDRRAARRRLCEARRLHQGRDLGAPTSTIATATCCAGRSCSSRTTISPSG